MKKITIYSTQTCPYCMMLKNWLDSKDIPYDNYNVDVTPIAAQQMLRESNGHRGVPFSTVEHEDGTVDKILGFDRPRFEQALAS